MLLRLVTLVALGTACLSATAADQNNADHQMTGAPLEATQVWSRAMPPTAPTGAVYFTLQNPGDSTDRLLGVHTPRAKKAELHTHVHEGEMMRMKQIDSIEVPAGGQVEFKPGSNHVMLFELSAPLVAGERFPLTLEFEHAGEVTIDVSIQDQAPEPSGHEHMQH
ncbi:copper chaperone PCu(A)C [Stutzerimonas stutzeri]|uniref:copper chaperone PCu(A)C n=1 Tax=Stutzerimonas stutzeri TaxID=316 RepID=UPI00210CF122|nr:copper chaperone PCu(A)C [Stutzerimonas stutzeri]MCQ4322649.1 copper chaperone PCu(A)C [Stutzerimonas stutzeri]